MDFKIAFGVADFKTGKLYDDPTYVMWVAQITTWKN